MEKTRRLTAICVLTAALSWVTAVPALADRHQTSSDPSGPGLTALPHAEPELIFGEGDFAVMTVPDRHQTSVPAVPAEAAV